jgi:uncharacterized membrane protein
VASLWAGGLLFMVTTLFPIMKRSGLGLGDRAAYLGRVIPRFSRLAIISVLLLAATGTYNLLVHTADPVALFDVAYGWVLGAKVALFLAVVLLGARNFRLYRPSANKSSDTQDGVPEFKLGRNVRLEAVLLLVAFSSAGALTLLPPPTATGRNTLDNLTSVNLTTLDSIEADSGEYTAALSVKKSSAAELFEVALEARKVGAPPLTDIGKVLLRITPQQGKIATTSVEAKPVDETSDTSSTWRAASSLTVGAGTYLVAVIAQRSATDDLKAGFILRRETDGTISLTNWDLVEARVSTDPDPPVTGRNTLRVRIVDSIGTPLNQGAAHVTLEDPASGRTAPETKLGSVAGIIGTFEGTIEFERAGSWTILTRLVRSGQPDTILDVSFDVRE